MERVFFQDVSKVRKAVETAFRRHRRRIKRLVPDGSIEHVGSTVIPNCLTKGDLDIQVRVPRAAYPVAKSALLRHYEILPGGFTGRSAVSFKDDNATISVGVHLTVMGGSSDIQWRFREVFLARADLLQAYDALKRRFEGKSMATYRRAKTRFFQKLRTTPEYRALNK